VKEHRLEVAEIFRRYGEKFLITGAPPSLPSSERFFGIFGAYRTAAPGRAPGAVRCLRSSKSTLNETLGTDSQIIE
jgi:hypothetical protein